MSRKPQESLVCFAYRGDELPLGPNLSGRPQIFQKLAKRSLKAVICLDAEAAFDPESVPDTVYDSTEQAITKAAEISDADALYGTLDYGFSQMDESDPDWHAIEFNGRIPYMIGYDKHAGVADTLRDMFADQIAATIRES